STTTSSNRRGWRWNSLQARESRLAWGLILPTAIIVFGLVIFPALYSVWISFHDVGLKNLSDISRAAFVGLENYRKVFEDYAFKFQGLESWGAAVTSVVYSFAATLLTVAVGLMAALLLNRPFRARGMARAIFLFPYVAPIVSVAFVWRWILDPRPSGVLND
ncbi:MAG: carbohydrate ABC transporter permease, partial [Anaerolineales bacterium]